MRQRGAMLAACLVATAVAVTSCSSSKSSPPPAANTSSAASTQAAASGSAAGSAQPAASGSAAAGSATARLDGVTLTLWTAAVTAHAADQVIQSFKQATGATVNTVVIPDPYETNLATKLATGAKPDLMFWQPTQAELSLIRGDQILQPLDGEPWMSSLSPNVSSMGVINGKHYAAMVSTPSTIGVYYNKNDFTKAGITSTPSNFAGLLDDAHKLKAAGVAPFYEAGGDKWPLQWIPVVLMADLTKSGDFWPALNKNQKSWTDPAIVSTITQYQSIIQSGLVNSDYKTGTFAQQADAVFSGTAGMAVQLNAMISQMQTKHTTAELDSNVGFFPISPNGNVGTFVPDQSNAVVAPKTGNAKQEAAARQLLAFWLGPDYSAYIASSKAVSIEPSVPTPPTVPQVAVDSFKALSNAVGAYQVEAIIAPDLHLDLADMLYGKKNPQQVAAACEQQFKQEATAQGKPGF
jgi:raffinose/stachyose/melibiose transport system substrate-binding protein